MKKLSLENKIKRTYIIFFSIIFIFMTLFMYSISTKVYVDNSIYLYKKLLDLNINILNEHIKEVKNIQNTITKDLEVNSAISYYADNKASNNRDYAKEIKIQRNLSEIFYANARAGLIKAAYIVDRDGEILYSYKESPKLSINMLDEKWYEDVVSNIDRDDSYISGIHTRQYLVNHSDEQCMSIIKPISINKNYRFVPKAYLVCDISLRSILDKNIADKNSYFIIIDKNRELYFQEESFFEVTKEKNLLEEIKEKKDFKEIVNTSIFSSSLVLSVKSEDFDLELVGVKKLDEMNKIGLVLFFILVLVSIISIILVILLSKKIIRSLLLPMNILLEECNEISKGNYDIPFEEKSSIEIEQLSETVKDMVDSIVELSNKLLLEERKLSDEKLRVLQHQINPHFLNNVLQSIKALALAGETKKVSRVSTLLGYILSYSIYKPYTYVNLREELDNVKAYIELQNIRYNDKIIYSDEDILDIDCIDDIKVPKLSLQPLIENSINHGFYGSPLLINISIEVENDIFSLIISDNGKGIDKNELELLRKKLSSNEIFDNKESIGVLNVNERLRRVFGSKYNMEIYSKENKGTSIIINIPRGFETDESFTSR